MSNPRGRPKLSKEPTKRIALCVEESLVDVITAEAEKKDNETLSGVIRSVLKARFKHELARARRNDSRTA